MAIGVTTTRKNNNNTTATQQPTKRSTEEKSIKQTKHTIRTPHDCNKRCYRRNKAHVNLGVVADPCKRPNIFVFACLSIFSFLCLFCWLFFRYIFSFKFSFGCFFVNVNEWTVSYRISGIAYSSRTSTTTHQKHTRNQWWLIPFDPKDSFGRKRSVPWCSMLRAHQIKKSIDNIPSCVWSSECGNTSAELPHSISDISFVVVVFYFLIPHEYYYAISPHSSFIYMNTWILEFRTLAALWCVQYTTKLN